MSSFKLDRFAVTLIGVELDDVAVEAFTLVQFVKTPFTFTTDEAGIVTAEFLFQQNDIAPETPPGFTVPVMVALLELPGSICVVTAVTVDTAAGVNETTAP